MGVEPRYVGHDNFPLGLEEIDKVNFGSLAKVYQSFVTMLVIWVLGYLIVLAFWGVMGLKNVIESKFSTTL